MHCRVAAERAASCLSIASDRTAGRVLLARGFYACRGRNHSRLFGGKPMTRKVVVTDYTFPDVAREEHAAVAAGASFAAFQCRTDGDVAQAVAGADVVAVQ